MTVTNLAESLITELRQTGRERLRELVRNPLCLTLLCHIWDGSGLPETQAELYGGYVKKFYSWNQNLQDLRDHAKRCGTNITILKKQLHNQLGELAKAALDTPQEGFRLSQSLVEKYLGEEDDQESLCYLALRLGWLNRTGRDKRGHIFAFYHATFQEYFAALAVENWDYFLPKDHENSPVKGKKYRIFEPQWKQVILLWLGREDIADEEKEEFINKLVNFDTGCHENGNFYYYRAYFLAAEGITQYGDFEPIGKIADIQEYSLVDVIVIQLIQWALGNFNTHRQEWITYVDPIKEDAKAALKTTKRTKVIDYLSESLIAMLMVETIDDLEDEITPEEIQESLDKVIIYLRWLKDHFKKGELILEFAELLLEINPNNEVAITGLIKILEAIKNQGIDCQVSAYTLGKIAQGNPQVISALVGILETSNNDSSRWKAADYLSRVDKGNSQAIAALIKILETNYDILMCNLAAITLSQTAQGNSQVIAELIRILENTNNEHIYIFTAETLGKISQGNHRATPELIRILEQSKDEDIRCLVASGLGEIDQGNIQVITDLIRIMEQCENEKTRCFVAFGLSKVDKGNTYAILELIRILENTHDENIRRRAAENLGKIEQVHPQVIAALIRIIENTEHEYARVEVTKSLGKVEERDPQVIAALTRILETNKHEYTCWRMAESLGKIDQGNYQAIAALTKILITTKDEYLCKQAAETLGKIDQGNPHAIETLIKILKTTKSQDMSRLTAESLQKILTTLEQSANAVSALKDCLSDEVHQNNFDRFDNCYKVLWDCAANLPYPDFYQAWHSPPE